MSTPTFYAMPILRIFDETIAKNFYLDFLGFKMVWEHRFAPDMPLYTEIARGGMRLHLSQHYGDTIPGFRTYIETTNLDEFHREITARGHENCRPGIAIQPWHAREMSLTDPFGNRLTFGEPIRQGDKKTT